MHTFPWAGWFVVAFAGATAVGCGAQPAPAAAAGQGSLAATAGGDACSAKQAAARDTVERAIDASQSCAQDADCVIVSLGAACFDSCGRVMAASGKAAYDQAVAEADAKYCAPYKADGCPAPVIPPCAANPAPKCDAGRCM